MHVKSAEINMYVLDIDASVVDRSYLSCFASGRRIEQEVPSTPHNIGKQDAQQRNYEIQGCQGRNVCKSTFCRKKICL